MISSYLVGIDIGTSAAKAVVVDAQGRSVGWAGREYPIHSPQPGWAEQDPEDWVSAVLDCIRQALQQARIDPRRVAGIGLGGQMHSLACLNSDEQPLRPAIIWADQRSADQVERLTAQLGRQHLGDWTGNPLATGFMLASWAWLQENEPQTTRLTRWLLLPKDYVRLRLTGKIGTEPSDASSTLLFDPHTGQWAARVLEMVDLPVERLPSVFPSHQTAGRLLREPAALMGLAEGTPVVFGGSDVSLQALALGIIVPGTVSCTIGTGGQLFAPTSKPIHDPELRMHLFCHAVPGTWHHETAILSAGLALRWLRDQFWTGAGYGNLADMASTVEGALDGLFFLPYLAGERTPYMNPTLRASFLGLGLRHSQAHLIRSVMEGVVFALRQGLERMISLGTPVDRLVASGGATRHPLWLQLQADIFDRPIYTAKTGHPEVSATARGAAMLAGVGAGLYPDIPSALHSMASDLMEAALPDPNRACRYADAFRVYLRWADLVAGQY